MDRADELELKDRLDLIQNMIAEGRRSTVSWGWSFVFWGLAYYVAIAWDRLGHYHLAWLITMTGAWLLMMIIMISIKGKQKGIQQGKAPSTTVSRAIFSIWMAMAVTLPLLLVSLGFSGRFNQQLFVAIVGAMLGTANGASGLLLRWKAQFASAVVWWAAMVLSLFSNETQCIVVFLVAIFFCQIVFGGYAMIIEGRARRQGAIHA